MDKLNIINTGVVIEHNGETKLILDGELPPNCIVVLMDKESWKVLQAEMEK